MPKKEHRKIERFYVLGVGESHAQVTSTLPRAWSASLLKAPGLKSMSVAAHPVPESHYQLFILEI